MKSGNIASVCMVLLHTEQHNQLPLFFYQFFLPIDEDNNNNNNNKVGGGRCCTGGKVPCKLVVVVIVIIVVAVVAAAVVVVWGHCPNDNHPEPLCTRGDRIDATMPLLPIATVDCQEITILAIPADKGQRRIVATMIVVLFPAPPF